ncbi:hypothetical protein [Pseudonocardia sp. T1-2H]|uniref:hypothetical protein n=1 Tax=Pseudonocardia sp. T1-2H TaxID=3128899 RepID=UPI003100DF86
MSQRVKEIVDGYLRRYPGARQANHEDAEFAMTTKLLFRILSMVDIAMDDEGVPAETRDRVLRMAMYGSVEDPVAADRRRALREERVQLLATTTRPVMFHRGAPDAGS